MVNGRTTGVGLGLLAVLCLLAPALGWLGPVGGAPDGAAQAEPAPLVSAVVAPAKAAPVKPAAPKVTLPPPVETVLQSGVLIVVSKASQQMYVFKDGAPWRSSPVSTGRRGHSTPSGIFPILQKKVFHRSNLYSNAPMPYMQRLTWTGIAIHAGHLPGYPASHGCIRLPREFAKALFDLTRASSTTVIVANEALASHGGAQDFALARHASSPRIPYLPLFGPPPALAAANLADRAFSPAASGPRQTIQLAAANSSAEAEAHWQRLVGARPELALFDKQVIPATVNARRFYRLRASAAGAHAACARLQRAGVDCLRVN